MADPIVLLALASLAGAALVLAPLPTLVAALAIALLLRGRARRRTLLLAFAALLLSALRARAELDAAALLYRRTTTLLDAPARCEAEGKVLSSPVVFRGAASESGAARVEVELERGFCGERALAPDTPLRARLYGAPEDLARGDRVAVVADLSPVHLFHNEELADPRPLLSRSGVTASGGAVSIERIERSRSPLSLIDRARAHVRRRIEATFHPVAAPLGRALVLGETDLDPSDDEAFRLSGLSHLLAVSGTHLVLAVAGCAAALRALLLRVEPIAARCDVGRVAAAFAIPASWLYADFSGGSGSAIRAAAMLSAAMLTRALGLRGAAVRSFACSLLLMSLWEPLLACDVSFMLSAGATAGLVVLQRPIAGWMVRGPGPVKAVLGAVATTLSAMAGCTPLVAMLSPTLPILGIAANLIAGPVGELAALPVCLAHAVLWWAPPLERGLSLLGSGALLGVRAVARETAAAGGVVSVATPTAGQLAVIAVAAVAVWAAKTRSLRALAFAAGVVGFCAGHLAASIAGAPKGVLRVSVLDVGQGDSTLIDLPDGRSMLIDAGGFVGSPIDTGERVVMPVLRSRRRSKLDIVVLSHPHPDHFGGLVSTTAGAQVGEFWDTGQGEEHGAGPAYAGMLKNLRERGIPIVRPDGLCGKPRDYGGATVEVLSPCPGFVEDASANDNSFVIRIRYGDRAVLLVGDAEHETEEMLLKRDKAALKADLLKTGHHGSRTSTTPAFLEAVSPSLATISCGVRNRFGHPHPKTLGTMRAHGVTFARTDRGGQVIWETDGREVWVRRADEGW